MSLAPAWTLVRRRSLRVMRRHAPYRRADGPALIQPMVGGLLRRPALLLGAACVLLVLGFQLWITPTNFKDYKSPLFVYLLAPVFRVTGPHKEVARGFA